MDRLSNQNTQLFLELYKFSYMGLKHYWQFCNRSFINDHHDRSCLSHIVTQIGAFISSVDD